MGADAISKVVRHCSDLRNILKDGRHVFSHEGCWTGSTDLLLVWPSKSYSLQSFVYFYFCDIFIGTSVLCSFRFDRIDHISGKTKTDSSCLRKYRITIKGLFTLVRLPGVWEGQVDGKAVCNHRMLLSSRANGHRQKRNVWSFISVLSEYQYFNIVNLYFGIFTADLFEMSNCCVLRAHFLWIEGTLKDESVS